MKPKFVKKHKNRIQFILSNIVFAGLIIMNFVIIGWFNFQNNFMVFNMPSIKSISFLSAFILVINVSVYYIANKLPFNQIGMVYFVALIFTFLLNYEELFSLLSGVNTIAPPDNLELQEYNKSLNLFSQKPPPAWYSIILICLSISPFLTAGITFTLKKVLKINNFQQKYEK